MERGDYLILLLVMRHRFIIDKLVGNQAILPGLVKMNHQGQLFVEIDLKLEQCFVYSLTSSGSVLMHKLDKEKNFDHNYYIENCLKPFINEIRKQEKSARTQCIKLLHDNTRSCAIYLSDK